MRRPDGERYDPRDAVPDVAAGGFAAFLEHVTGVPGLSGPLAPALAVTWRGVRELDRRQWRQAAQAVQVAADELDADLSAVGERSLVDEAHAELLRRVVQGAGHASFADKVDALGRVLALGVEGDDAKVDEALVLAAALTELEAAHVRLLAFMARRGMYTDHAAELGKRPRLHPSRLGEALPGSELVATNVLRTLERHGLADDPNPDTSDGGDMSVTDPDYSDAGYAVTPLGRRCLELLSVSAEELTRRGSTEGPETSEAAL